MFTENDAKEYLNGQTKFVIDKVINRDDVKTVLNIGYKYNSDLTIENKCKSLGKTFTVLEVFSFNCEELRARDYDIIEMDVRDIKNLDRTFDAIIWLHGPEHVTWEQFLNIRKDIESKANKIVMYQAPIGHCPQGAEYGNEYEIHLSTLTGEMFKELGYNVLNNLHAENPEYALPSEWTFSAWIEKE